MGHDGVITIKYCCQAELLGVVLVCSGWRWGLHQKPTSRDPVVVVGRCSSQFIGGSLPVSLSVLRVRQQGSFLSELRNMQNSLLQNNPPEGGFFARCRVIQMGLRSGGRRGTAGVQRRACWPPPLPLRARSFSLYLESSLRSAPDPHPRQVRRICVAGRWELGSEHVPSL